MAISFTVGIVGAKELREVMSTLTQDFGPNDAKNILRGAVRQAMKPALESARAAAPVDTGGLKASLRIEAKKPSRKDKRSKYINENDVVIATVTTAPGNVLAKTKFFNERTKAKQLGIESDARAVAMEFGTANVAPRPYLRAALESNAGVIVNDLSNQIKVSINKYTAKKASKAKKG